MRMVRHRREGRGEQSSLACKGTCTKMACCVQCCFWQGKKGVVLHYHWEFLTKVCYRLLIKTLKNHINLWKMGIRWPLVIINTSDTTLIRTAWKEELGFTIEEERWEEYLQNIQERSINAKQNLFQFKTFRYTSIKLSCMRFFQRYHLNAINIKLQKIHWFIHYGHAANSKDTGLIFFQEYIKERLIQKQWLLY